MISGLAITDDNYPIAVRVLRDRYDDASRQTHVLLQKFHTLPTPKHNSKDLRNFLIEYRKVRTQLSHVVDFQQSELVIKSTLVRKLAFQTFDKICDLYIKHKFSLKQMETDIHHIIDKLEQATPAMGEKANVKQVGVSSQQPNQQTKQSNQKTNQQCSYCSGSYFSYECTKYKTVDSRKDRIMSLKFCFNCLKPGHSSKTFRSTRTCHTCGLHHHLSPCINAHSNSNSSEASNPSPSNSNSTVCQGKSIQSSTNTSSTNNRSSKAQAQMHPNKPVVTPNKSNSCQASGQSPAVDTTYVTCVNSTSFPNNVLPTTTLNVRYCDKQVIVRAFFDTGSHCSFMSPDVVKRLNLRVIKQIPANLSTFGNETESCMLDLVKVKVRLGKHKILIILLVHDSAAMGYFNCPGLFDVAQQLKSKGFHLADHDITSDTLTGIKILIEVDHFTRLIMRQKRSQGTSLFVKKGGGVIPFGPLPRWATSTSKQSTSQIRCARIICENKPEIKVTQLCDLERIGIIPESFSPNK